MPWLKIVAGALALMTAAAVLFLRRRRRAKTPVFYMTAEQDNGEAAFSALEEYNSERTNPGIYLLGGFRVIDRRGRDITGDFTPVMKQILSLIILYTCKGTGISNQKLKDFLWLDKGEDSARNNRSVNIRKIRLLLEGVGGFDINTDNSYWTITPGEGDRCDYISAVEFLKELRGAAQVASEQMTRLLKIASRGALLPNQQFEWLDSFKGDYADMIIEVMARLCDSRTPEGDHRTRILLSEGILKFDTLDEASVRVKCRALVALGKIGVAKATFDTFTREYRQLMGEDYSDGFDKFVK